MHSCTVGNWAATNSRYMCSLLALPYGITQTSTGISVVADIPALQSHDHNHVHRGWYFVVLVTLDTAYLCKKFHGSFMARWKARGRLPISANWTFFASSHGWGTERIIGRNRCVRKGDGLLWGQIWEGMGRLPPTTVGSRKTIVPRLSRGVVCVILGLAIVTDRRTDGQTDG